MANKSRGEVSLELGGKTYLLKFVTNSICDMEEAANLSMAELGARVQGNPGKRDLRLLLWGGLRKNYPNMTLRQAGELLDDADNALVGEKLGEAFRLAFPDPESGGAENPPQAAAPETNG